jgi:hypothetical protein
MTAPAVRLRDGRKTGKVRHAFAEWWKAKGDSIQALFGFPDVPVAYYLSIYRAGWMAHRKHIRTPLPMEASPQVLELVKSFFVFYGVPPYDDPANHARGDGYFWAGIQRQYSKEVIAVAHDIALARRADWQAARDRWVECNPIKGAE